VIAETAVALAVAFAGQTDAPSVVYEVAGRADRYWEAKGAGTSCDDELAAWVVPRLQDGDEFGTVILGRGAPCQLWITEYAARSLLDPRTWQEAARGCAVVLHEVGHTRGLAHTSRGVMSENVDDVPPPATCRRWGRNTMRAIWRGDGLSEREIRRRIRS
jgi:hypothetical protein